MNTNMLNNLEEMNKFLKKHSLSRLNHEEIKQKYEQANNK